ncbi:MULTISPECIES: LysR family transcriptional regulator [Pseudomonas]|uniref:LysR family transcriptional regulator n=2 Tax=Pseudomonadaceae TaxID=135621 RepID=A0A0D0KL83_9PSED|nr:MULTISPECIES: LysR family transcriptional regulator [Pseudomonas]KIP98822.1 LysR family transcriptional regulator [Pseudomonas fulva]MCW2291280.1 DNA-binding transcriptional LysR family regulator [Pseudomonas sp. BIGb0408]NYH74149.1 DNA-binding transcriptional LysR family regulator [Pseudomonas flavescens]
MAKPNLNDLLAFATTARERSFTRAAAQLGISRSALSHKMRALEELLGMQLLTRTTRSVSTTEAGARLLSAVAPRISEIEEELASLTALREKPAGMVRITANDHSIQTVLWPRLLPLLEEYPDIQIEFSADYGFTDIAAQRFNAGVRLGDSVDKDMIATRIAPDMRMAIGAAPKYLEGKRPPASPHELTEFDCINLRLPTYGGLYAWEFEKDGNELSVRVEGQVIFNNAFLMIKAAIDGRGLVYAPFDILEQHFKSGELEPLLEDWCATFPGYHIYYASRRQVSPALTLVINALRYHQAP